MRQFFKMVKNKENVMGVDDRDYVREERKNRSRKGGGSYWKIFIILLLVLFLLFILF
jgi:hypothetical protein